MLCINDTVNNIYVKVEDHYMSAITFSDHTAARMVDVDTEWLHWEAGGRIESNANVCTALWTFRWTLTRTL